MTTISDHPVLTPQQKTGTDTGEGAPRPLTPDDLQVSRQVTADPGRPTSAPPGTAAAATATAIGAWQTDKRVSAMWANASTRNAYMHVDGLGWRRLHSGNDSAWSALVALASQARQTSCRIDYREEADGLIHEITLW